MYGSPTTWPESMRRAPVSSRTCLCVFRYFFLSSPRGFDFIPKFPDEEDGLSVIVSLLLHFNISLWSRRSCPTCILFISFSPWTSISTCKSTSMPSELKAWLRSSFIFHPMNLLKTPPLASRLLSSLLLVFSCLPPFFDISVFLPVLSQYSPSWEVPFLGLVSLLPCWLPSLLSLLRSRSCFHLFLFLPKAFYFLGIPPFFVGGFYEAFYVFPLLAFVSYRRLVLGTVPE